MSSSEEKEYDDQIVIVDGIGITHFIPRRTRAQEAAKKHKGERRRRQATGRRPRSR